MHRNHLKEAAWFPSYDGCHAKGPVPTLGHPAVPPSPHLRESLKALLPLFLQGHGKARPQHSKTKPSSALSPFLNRYPWPTRAVIRLGLKRQGSRVHLWGLPFPV
jgi:hypothetical protein